MTENESIEIIKYASAFNSDNSPLTKALEVAIQALEEIQAYRAIGTIEELQALKEKAEPKKPISIDVWGEYWKCPTCGKYVVDNWGCKYKYCRECGTKFDWP